MLATIFLLFVGILFTTNYFNPNTYLHLIFRNTNQLCYSTKNNATSPSNYQFSPRSLPTEFIFKNKTHKMTDFISSQGTTGLVVLKVANTTSATILFEEYYRGTHQKSQVISWSVGKSITSALVGIAHQEGYLKLNNVVADYVPEFSNAAYGNITIKNLLTMSSGIDFLEDYSSDCTFATIFWNILFNPEAPNFGGLLSNMLFGQSQNKLLLNLKSKRPQGIITNYISTDTQMLAIVLRAAIGRSLSEYLEEKIWIKGGFECNFYWLTDNTNLRTEYALGTLNTCTRDYARFGWLYLNHGLSPLDARRVIDEQWIINSVTSSEDYLKPGYSGNDFGYGYQWWLPKGSEGDYMAIGIFNQFIYVSPKYGIVIAKNSANPDYTKDGVEEESEAMAVQAFRTIAQSFGEH